MKNNFNKYKINKTRKFAVRSALILFFILLSTIYYKSFIKADISLISRLRGFIIIQTEKHGEAWYIDPHTDERYFLGRPADAFAVMRDLGVGISNKDIEKIPTAVENLKGADSDGDGLPDNLETALGLSKSSNDTDKDGFNDYDELKNNYNPKGAGNLSLDKNYAKMQAGKILIQVEQNGEAWYVYPKNSKKYFLGRPSDAFGIMRSLGLGITNSDLASIPAHSTNEKAQNDYITQNNTTISQTNNDLRIYTDPIYPYSFSYPADWKIKKSIDSDNTIFIGDYSKNLFGERKGMITLTYITSQKDLELKNFEIVKKDKAEKKVNNFTKINGYDAYTQEFYYPTLNSFDITTNIKINSRLFIHVVIASAGEKAKYSKIYNDLLNSLKFTHK